MVERFDRIRSQMIETRSPAAEIAFCDCGNRREVSAHRPPELFTRIRGVSRVCTAPHELH
jgi:hypothetical protein